MPHYNVWTKHGEIGVMMEDNEEEEYDDLRRVIVDARTQCESEKEKLKFNRMLEDDKKGLYPNFKEGITKLGTVLEILQWKEDNAVPDKGFEQVLKIFKKNLPNITNYPALRTQQRRSYAL